MNEIQKAFDRELTGFFEYYSEEPDRLTHRQAKLMHEIYTYLMRDKDEQEQKA